MWPAGVGLPCPCCGFGVVAWTRDCGSIACDNILFIVCVCTSPPQTHHFPANLPVSHLNQRDQGADWCSSVSGACIAHKHTLIRVWDSVAGVSEGNAVPGWS